MTTFRMDYDKELQSFINECISTSINEYILSETARIRPWNSIDYMKTNPLQVDVSDEAYQYVDDDSAFSNMPKKKAEIKDKYQDELTKRVRDRVGKDQVKLKDLMAANGNKSKYNSVFSDDKLDKIQNRLGDSIKRGNMDVSIKGKIFAYGNTKLPTNTMIFNLTSALNCPSRLCKLHDVCYACKDDNRWIDPLLKNLRSQIAVNHLTLREFLKLIEIYIEYAPMRIKRIRISESGDFLNQRQVDIAKKIAAHLKAKYDIDTVVYTAQPFDFSGGELIVNASNDKVVGATRYFFAKDIDTLNSLKIDTTEDKKLKLDQNGNPYLMCSCDCRKCGFCYRSKEENGEDASKITTVYEKLRGGGGNPIQNLDDTRKTRAKRSKK